MTTKKSEKIDNHKKFEMIILERNWHIAIKVVTLCAGILYIFFDIIFKIKLRENKLCFII